MSYTLNSVPGPDVALDAQGAFTVDLETAPGNVLILDSSSIGPPGPKGDQGDQGPPGTGDAMDALVVHLAGAETITGAKVFEPLVHAKSYVLVGDTTSTPIQMLRIGGNHPGAAATMQGLTCQPVAPATTTAKWQTAYLQTRTAAATFTLPTAIGLEIDNPQVGAGSIITDDYGLVIDGQTRGTGLNVGAVIGTSTTVALWLAYATSTSTTPAGGIAFGSQRDTNLYRVTAATLKTDGNLFVGAVGHTPVLGAAGAFQGFSGGGIIGAYSTDAAAINKGGSLMFGGAYTGAAQTIFGGIMARKETATDGDFAGYLSLGARPAGGNVIEYFRIASTGATSIFGGSLAIGATPATFGTLRIPSAGSIYFRNAANTGNNVLIAADASDNVSVNSPTNLFLVVAAANKVSLHGSYWEAADGYHFAVGSTLGNQIGTAPTQRLAFFGANPIVRPVGTPAAATDPATTTALVNSLRASLVALGLVG